MECNRNLGYLMFLLWTGIAMHCGGGTYGVTRTLALLKKHGPPKGSGNPAVDHPPLLKTWDQDFDTSIHQKIDIHGNHVPKAFAICIGILGGWASILSASSILFAVALVRQKNILKNLECSGGERSNVTVKLPVFLTGYCVFLLLACFIHAGFMALPLLEYRITMQRCQELKYPEFQSPSIQRAICIDLVQFGLVRFRDHAITGFGTLCGGNEPARGHLHGFCNECPPVYYSFVASFTGVLLVAVALVVFAIRLNATVVRLKAYKSSVGPCLWNLQAEPDWCSDVNVEYPCEVRGEHLQNLPTVNSYRQHLGRQSQLLHTAGRRGVRFEYGSGKKYARRRAYGDASLTMSRGSLGRQECEESSQWVDRIRDSRECSDYDSLSRWV